MFAVKGWNVSADKLKTETPNPLSSKKRKRPDNETKVTASRIGGLWEKVIEQKGSEEQRKPSRNRRDRKEGKRQKVGPGSQPITESSQDGQEDKKDKKKDKKDKTAKVPGPKEPETVRDSVGLPSDDEEWGGIEDEDTAALKVEDSKPKDKKHKDKKTKGDAAPPAEKASSSRMKDKKPAEPTEAAKQAPAAKLTPLQASMREKLVSARFRHLNETLYTRPSAESFKLFHESPEMFTEYHEGFRRQVDVWPENPVVGYVADIQARAKQRFPPKTRTADSVLPLPRTQGTCTVADLGCGDAALATALQKAQKKLHLDVKSFDLQTGGSSLITKADIANLPLRDGSVDVAVFCLALMGTNWIDFVEEAYRVLRWKGELWVAEIKSRFAQPGKRKVVDHSIGSKKKAPSAKKGKKGDNPAEEGANETDLAVEVDGADDRRQETDVSTFVEVLAKRGFMLRGEPSEAVDLSNKMFVKMYFVKAAPAVRGKCVDASRMAMVAAQGRPKKKFITNDDDEPVDNPADEAKVLKPCVYKLR